MGRGNPRGGSLVYIDKAGVQKMQALERVLKSRDNGKALKKQLNAELREATKPLVDDLARSARNLNFTRTSRAGGSRKSAGRAYKIKNAKVKGEDGKFLKDDKGDYVTERTRVKKTKAERKRGLRDEIAYGVQMKTDYGKTAGVRIRMASKDADVNRLARTLDRRGSIRHPLFGNRKSWHVTQTTNGKGWWTDTAEPQLPLVRRRVGVVLDRWVNDLAAKIDRAA